MSTKSGRAVSEEESKALVAAVLEHIFLHYPNVGRRAGRQDLDARVPEVGPRVTAGSQRLRVAVAARLCTLPGDVDPEIRADLGAAAGFLDDEHFCATALGRDHAGPLDWLAESDLSGYLDRPYAPLADRVAALDAHVAALPRFLAEAAAVVPDRLPAGERMRGVERARAQAEHVRDVVRELATEHPEVVPAGLDTRAEEAAGACEALGRAVAAATPVNSRFGPDLLAGYLHTVVGIDDPLDDLLAEASHEVDDLAARLDTTAAKAGAHSRGEAYALMARPGPERSVLDALRAAVDRLKDFWTAQDVLTLDVETPLEIRRTTRLSGAARVEYNVSPPLAAKRWPHRLTVPEPTGAGGADIRREYLNDPMLEVIAVHEVYAGHYAHLEAALRRGSVLRTCVPWFPAFTEGWAHYAEELAVERGLAEGRPLVEVAQLRSALEAATRLLLFLSLHSGRWTFLEAADRAAALCGWSPERAAREVLVVAAEPGGAMYTLGKLRIRAWRGRAGDPRTFHDRLMRCGSAPLPTAWRYYLDTRDAVPAGVGS